MYEKTIALAGCPPHDRAGRYSTEKKSQTSGNRQFQVYAVGFYNQENLFDTCHDAGKNDYEYLPAKGWNGMKYTNKLKNMSRALADMGTDVLPNVAAPSSVCLRLRMPTC